MFQQVLILLANGYGQWPKHVAVIYLETTAKYICEEFVYLNQLQGRCTIWSLVNQLCIPDVHYAHNISPTSDIAKCNYVNTTYVPCISLPGFQIRPWCATLENLREKNLLATRNFRNFYSCKYKCKYKARWNFGLSRRWELTLDTGCDTVQLRGRLHLIHRSLLPPSNLNMETSDSSGNVATETTLTES